MMNRDAAKHIGARNTSPVSSARGISLMLIKSSWLRISTDLKYNPYWPIRREELKGSERLCKVVELSVQFCGKLLSDSFETY